jgi:Cyclic nucleotide-binding domain
LMARLAPDAILARLFGLQESLVSLTVGLGALVASLLIDLTSVSTAMVAVGALCPILVVAAWRRLRQPDRHVGELDKDIALLHSVPMLQPLPLPAIEQLARGSEPVHVPAGRAVFRQGDPGDRFYVIETGAAEVVGDGRLVTTLGPGDGFGEIALLRRVRRTATVRAATDLELQALTCERFLPVVTGFPPSAREAGAEVDTLLNRFNPDKPTDDQNWPRH